MSRRSGNTRRLSKGERRRTARRRARLPEQPVTRDRKRRNDEEPDAPTKEENQ